MTTNQSPMSLKEWLRRKRKFRKWVERIKMKQIYMVIYEYSDCDTNRREVSYCDNDNAARKLFKRKVNYLLRDMDAPCFDDIPEGSSLWVRKNEELVPTEPNDTGTTIMIKKENKFILQYLPSYIRLEFTITHENVWTEADCDNV